VTEPVVKINVNTGFNTQILTARVIVEITDTASYPIFPAENFFAKRTFIITAFLTNPLQRLFRAVNFELFIS
jgi:hypothetical protein